MKNRLTMTWGVVAGRQVSRSANRRQPEKVDVAPEDDIARVNWNESDIAPRSVACDVRKPAGSGNAGPTGKFHKRRDNCPEERAIAKAHGVTSREARKLLRHAQEANERKTANQKNDDWLVLHAQNQRAAMLADSARLEADLERAARVAAFLETL